MIKWYSAGSGIDGFFFCYPGIGDYSFADSIALALTVTARSAIITAGRHEISPLEKKRENKVLLDILTKLT